MSGHLPKMYDYVLDRDKQNFECLLGHRHHIKTGGGIPCCIICHHDLRSILKENGENMNDLQFPFIEVKGLDIAFGFSNRSNYARALKECPEQFKVHDNTPYHKLFSKMFYSGLTKNEIAALHFRSGDQLIKNKQLAYLQSIMASFEPKHEDKEAVCAWILSLIVDLDKE